MNGEGEALSKVAVFGPFGSTNLGNEATLQAVRYHLDRHRPPVDLTCVCTAPDVATAIHGVKAIPITESFVGGWVPKRRVGKILQKVFIAVPSEPLRWLRAARRLRSIDVLIVPGTGLLTNVGGLLGWGPYGTFKWSLLAKICRCRLLFVSVGAGPVHRRRGKSLIKVALALADYRSFRDESSKEHLERAGVSTEDDPVFPDLVFSLPEDVIPEPAPTTGSRPVVGIGVMVSAGRDVLGRSDDGIYRSYVENLARTGEWLVGRGYDVRLLIGDHLDASVVDDVRAAILERLPVDAHRHILYTPPATTEELLSQIGATEFLVATRFHTIVFALICNKPVISVSFHHKCDSLMQAMGLGRYRLDGNNLRAEDLTERLVELDANAESLKRQISGKNREFRRRLDLQYERLFDEIGHARPAVTRPPDRGAVPAGP